MKVIPKLNLNKHPSACDNGSLIDATNLMISTDNEVLQSEPILDENSINSSIYNLFNSQSYLIVGVIPCNKEAVLFVKLNSDFNNVNIVRYNEINKSCINVTKTSYHGGKIIGTFTYNFENLIISFSEYFVNSNIKIPLKVINLGNINNPLLESDYDYNQLYNSKLHSICPEVKIPEIITSYKYGISYKGWYYIFIRYKISNNTYTQWFNTNASIYIDNFNQDDFFNYYVSKDAPKGEQLNDDAYANAKNIISTNNDICDISFDGVISGLDNNYFKYQIGFICISKSYSKCFKTDDIDIKVNNFNFSSNTVSSYDINSIIKTYINYYNIKTLVNNNNRLYIANYKEDNREFDIKSSLKNINLNLKFKAEHINYKNINIIVDNKNNQSITLNAYKDNKSKIYFKGTNCYFITNDYHGFNEKSFYNTDSLTLEYLAKDKTTKTINIWAEDILFYPFEPNNQNPNIKGNIYFKISNILVDDIDASAYNKITTVKIKAINEVPIESIVDFYFGFKDLKFKEYYDYGEINNSINTLNNNFINPENYYNFFIHFVDKYGHATNGFNINYFNNNTIVNANTIINKINNKLVSPNIKALDSIILADISIDKFPNNYIGYFVTYEQIDKTVKYNCISKYVPNKETNTKLFVYNDEFNYADNIDLDFDELRVYDTKVIDRAYANTYIPINQSFLKNNLNYDTYRINSKKILVADAYNNISESTKIVIDIDVDASKLNNKICKLAKFSTNLYNKQNKTLIPCSNIIYNNEEALINTKTAFISKHHAIIFNKDVYYNKAINIFQKQKGIGAITRPFRFVIWDDYAEVPVESLQYNNKPEVIFFPDKGLNETDVNKKSFIVGNIVEAKNTIDLYQQKQVPVYELYPKSLIWYNPNITINNNYPKTIRRSNIIQDESRAINWRNFELEQYKNITENKGDIMKLVSIGYFFIAHTQHSMFLFNATDTIRATQKDIQLASIDIWDINYKEVLTSDLGYAGIQNEKHGLTGEFGYIFFDKDSKRIYRYDNNKLDFIDNDINKYIYKFSSYDYVDIDVNIVDDKQRNRLMFNFINLNRPIERIVLSYNYKTNTFVSRHTNKFVFGFATKNNSYYINDESKILTYNNSNYNNSTCSIIINTEYPVMKYLEYIQYKVKQITPNQYNNYLPVEGITRYYPGDRLKIYSEECNTGLIDISIAKPEDNVNKVTDYSKPYWELGNWNFNMIRNNFTSYQEGNTEATDSSRVYGNWFVTHFEFDSLKQVEIETIEAKLNES